MKKILLALFTLFFLSCQKDIQIGSDTGTGGSLARFTIVDKKIYIVTTDSLKTYDITQPQTPQYESGQMLGWGGGDIETIFPFVSRLFIGSRERTTRRKISTIFGCIVWFFSLKLGIALY